jgi:hypothetical protein
VGRVRAQQRVVDIGREPGACEGHPTSLP